jgi:predicted enzyme related to lactoylglutathione lyase
MAKVVGIGGVFFKSRDPEALRQWYERHLGIPASEWGHSFDAGGQTAWSLFPAETEYFGPKQQGFMINYRVDDLEAMLAQLRDAGVDVDSEVGDYDYGKFGWATDPEGNRFELWQPA